MKKTGEIEIGLMTDLHYAGTPESAARLEVAVDRLNRAGAARLVVTGDLIDAPDASTAVRLLQDVSAMCGRFRGPVRFLPGNHDLDHLSKERFCAALGQAETVWSESWRGVRLIALDGNFSPDGSTYAAGNFGWRASYLPPSQLDWLAVELANAAEPVLLFTHQCLDAEGEHSVRNHDAVRAVITASGCVRAVFQGHRHVASRRVVAGVPFYTFAAFADGAAPEVVRLEAGGIRLAGLD